jgi:hypothetical protein
MPFLNGGFEVTPSTAEAAGQDLRAAGAGIESVSGQLSALAGTGFELTGQAVSAGAFNQMVSSWTKELAGLGSFVTATGDGATTAAGNYTVTEYGVSEMFGGSR